MTTIRQLIADVLWDSGVDMPNDGYNREDCLVLADALLASPTLQAIIDLAAHCGAIVIDVSRGLDYDGADALLVDWRANR